MANLSGLLPALYIGLSSLMVHKLCSSLTMLGMIFGVGAVVAMLAITAGAQKEMMSYIDLLGVNNIIIEAKEAVDRNELQARRVVSPGLTFRDYRAITENVQGLEALTPRKRFKPLKVLPKPSQETPLLIGVEPSYLGINNLKIVEGRFFNDEDNAKSAPVCVLGESAKVNLLGYEPADLVGRSFYDFIFEVDREEVRYLSSLIHESGPTTLPAASTTGAPPISSQTTVPSLRRTRISY